MLYQQNLLTLYPWNNSSDKINVVNDVRARNDDLIQYFAWCK